MDSRPAILVVGSINRDLIVRASRLPAPGETVVDGEFSQAHGGKGANQAVAAARAGTLPVAMVGAVGDDSFGREGRQALVDDGIDVSVVANRAKIATGVAIIAVDHEGRNAIAVASGANATVSAAQLDEIPSTWVASLRVVLVSLEIPLSTVAMALRWGRERGLFTILNPAPVVDALRIVKELLPWTSIVTPNEIEAEQLTGVAVTSSEGVRSALTRLRELGVSRPLVTLGAEGVAFLDQEGNTQRTPALHVDAVDTTAAGDAFNGCLAGHLAENPHSDWETAIRFAVAGASLSVTRLGAQPSLPTRAEIEQVMM